MKNILAIGLIISVLIISACNDDGTIPPVDPYTIYDNEPLTQFEHNPQTYSFPALTNFPQPIIPADNLMTIEGVELGRRLFYDPILSGDSTMSCATCHKQELAFSDDVSFSMGIDGQLGPRNASPLINLAFIPNGLNWDGSSPNLETQAIIPITSEVELHANLGDIELSLKRHNLYPEWFRNAFDIQTKGEITEVLARKALAQFVRSLVSARSKWDASLGYVPGYNPFLSNSEQRGRTLFLSELSDSTDKECGHCHGGGGRLFTNNDFINNGLTAAPTMTEFPDLGLGGVTGIVSDNGRFRTPTLRNIELTGPYMHDGSIETLEEVLDHYADHLQDAPNLEGILSARLTGNKIYFTQQEKEDLLAFLKILTDTDFTTNPAHSNPW